MFNEDDPVLGYFEYKDGRLVFELKNHLSSLINSFIERENSAPRV